MGDWIQHDKPLNNIPQDYDWGHMTSNERSNFVFHITFFCVWLVAAILLRKSAYFGWMWRATKFFLISLLFCLIANRLKKDLK